MTKSESGKIGGNISAEITQEKRKERQRLYNLNPRLCVCGINLTYEQRKRKYCSLSCSARHNVGRKTKRYNYGQPCANCGITTKNAKFCSKVCDSENTVKLNQQKWLDTGIEWTGSKKYIINDQHGLCAICQIPELWNNKPIVFISDHIDGNSENNWRKNLRCICPNCDSQLDTYKSKNRGNGRHKRRQRYQDGKSY